QGAMVLFAALAVARLSEKMPLWLAIIAATLIMIALAWLIERLVLRPLVHQEGVALLMATLGVTYFLDGFAQTVGGGDIYKIHLGARGDRRRPDHRPGREDGRGIPRSGAGESLRPRRWRNRELVRLRARASLPAGAARGPLRREAHRSGLTHALPGKRPVQVHL